MNELLSLWNLDGPEDAWEVNPLLIERKRRLAEMGVRVEDLRKMATNVKANPETGCWEWSGYREVSGYGRLSVRINGKKKSIKTHRISLLASGGVLSSERPLCCHTCDNPPCLNPYHLFPGSKKDNAIDMANKGRAMAQKYPERLPRGDDHFLHKFPEKILKGSSHGGSKLTEPEVRQIRKLCSQGISDRQIAFRFSVTPSSVGNIRKRKNWTHI